MRKSKDKNEEASPADRLRAVLSGLTFIALVGDEERHVTDVELVEPAEVRLTVGKWRTKQHPVIDIEATVVDDPKPRRKKR